MNVESIINTDIKIYPLVIHSSSKFGSFMKTMMKLGKVKGHLTLKDGTTHTFYLLRQENIENGDVLYHIDVI
jgi:hypothetical protein